MQRAASTTRSGSKGSPDWALLAGLSAIKLLLHVLTNFRGGYGYFRDELYYIACSDHLALGYVDHPPLSILVLAMTRRLLGDSMFALRLPPAVAGSATVLLSGLMAHELGGGRFAQALAAIASMASLTYMAMNSYYSMNSFDILLWASAAYVLIRLIHTANPRCWLALGLILGMGLLNKISVLWLGLGIFGGLVLTPHRRWLKTRWPWLAGCIALGLFLPYVYWNAAHGMPTLEFIRNATAQKYSSLSPATFLVDQILQPNPIAMPLWSTGAAFFLASARARELRILGAAYAVVLLVLLLNGHTKGEYLSPVYSMLFAGGAVAVEDFTAAPRRRWLRPAYACLLGASGLVLSPAVIPILPVETYIRYADALRIQPSTSENKALGKLPQFYADMFGWEEKAQAVAKVYRSLSPEEQSRCAIFADNYGRSAAIDFFGGKVGLPKAIGNHNNYWLWGPREYAGQLMIILGGDLEDKQERFEQVEVAGIVTCEYCMPYENRLSIYVCRNLTTRLKDVWPQLKHYD